VARSISLLKQNCLQLIIYTLWTAEASQTCTKLAGYEEP
jgi:hypothetical protein